MVGQGWTSAGDSKKVLRGLDGQRLVDLQQKLKCLSDIQRKVEVRWSFGKLAYLLIILL
jgi:hypothetical protein